MASGKKIKFIYNPHAGLLHPLNHIKKIINQYFPPNLCEYDLEVTGGRGAAHTYAQRAVEQGYDIVVAIGGDGTINEIASALINTDLWLGIVPAGSGNGLARGLGIPLSIKKAIRLITTGKVRSIDAGKVNNNFFFTTAGFGFDAAVGKRFEEAGVRGPVPYFLAGVREYFSYKQPEFKIEFAKKKLKLKALVVAIANVRQYGNNAIIAPDAIPDDGLLDLFIVRSVNFLPTILHLPKLFTGKIQKAPYVELYQGKEFKIIRDGPGIYHVDGEILEEKKEQLTISIIPRALKVIVKDVNY